MAENDDALNEAGYSEQDIRKVMMSDRFLAVVDAYSQDRFTLGLAKLLIEQRSMRWCLTFCEVWINEVIPAWFTMSPSEFTRASLLFHSISNGSFQKFTTPFRLPICLLSINSVC
jgi:hypothetical protein